MLNHVPGKEDVSLLIDDEGNLFLICAAVNKYWTGKLTPNDLPKSTGDISTASASGSTQITDALDQLSVLAKSNSDILMQTGLNADVVFALRDLDLGTH